MPLDRIDLADLRTPQAIARAIHAQLGNPDTSVPVTQIATALGIGEVREETSDGFEGMLLTDLVRSQGYDEPKTLA